MARPKKEEQLTEKVTIEQSLELIKTVIRKKFGEGSLVSGMDAIPSSIERLSSGSPALDIALCGGYGRGRIIELIGAESAGKTSLALAAVAECQRNGGLCAYIDAENALDNQYISQLGVDIDKLEISQPSCGEEALEIVDLLVRSKIFDLIIVDSVAALTPKAELEGEMTDSQMGLQARMMGKALRKFSGICSNTNTTIIFINQIRNKIGISFGSNETTPGGNALKFFASQRLDIRRVQVIKDGQNAIGITSRIKVIKTKIGRPFRQVEIDIIFGKGVDWAKDLLRLAVDKDLIEKSGAWYIIGDQKLQGEGNAAEYIKQNKELEEKLRKELII